MLVGEPRMLLPRRFLTVGRSLTRVGYRQRGGEHQHLAHAAFGVGLHDHARQPRIHRQLREPAADFGDRPARVKGAEFLQQLNTVADAALLGRVEKRKALDVAELQRRHLEDHRGQVGAQDLRIGVAGTTREVLLGVQPDAHPGCGTPGAAGPLRGRGLRDRLDRQPLHLGAPAVAGYPRGPRINDVADARHGE